MNSKKFPIFHVTEFRSLGKITLFNKNLKLEGKFGQKNLKNYIYKIIYYSHLIIEVLLVKIKLL